MRFKEDRINERSEDREVVVSRQKALVAMKDQLKKKEMTLRQV